jgi:metallo-beta-lactamase class B
VKGKNVKGRTVKLFISGICFFALILGSISRGSASAGEIAEQHREAARKAATVHHQGLFEAVCEPRIIMPKPGEERRRPANWTPPPVPGRAHWYRAPVKIFDNLIFLGQSEYSAWAVLTSEGIIVLDTLFDYSVKDEIVEGLKKLGLDPADIKYAVVSHGHNDHGGGARYLQENFGTRIVMSARDWDMLARRPEFTWQPKRDIEVTEDTELTLGDTTLKLYLTPGHTPGTISTIIPVKDNGVPHVAAEWGGTMLTFERTPAHYQTYIASAERFREIMREAGADVMISNHTKYDGSQWKLGALAVRGRKEAHPYMIGGEAARSYLTIVEECAKAGMAHLLKQ